MVLPNAICWWTKSRFPLFLNRCTVLNPNIQWLNAKVCLVTSPFVCCLNAHVQCFHLFRKSGRFPWFVRRQLMSRLAGSLALDLRSSAGRTRRTWERAELRQGLSGDCQGIMARKIPNGWLGQLMTINYRTKWFFSSWPWISGWYLFFRHTVIASRWSPEAFWHMPTKTKKCQKTHPP